MKHDCPHCTCLEETVRYASYPPGDDGIPRVGDVVAWGEYSSFLYVVRETSSDGVLFRSFRSIAMNDYVAASNLALIQRGPQPRSVSMRDIQCKFSHRKYGEVIHTLKRLGI